jgi:hypothetical protein
VTAEEANALLSLTARTNAALRDDHPRKITQRDVATLAALADLVERNIPAEAKLAEMADALRVKLAALLPFMDAAAVSD